MMPGFEQPKLRDEASSLPTESHYIETPEQVDLQYSVAGVGSRFLAALLDVLVLAAFFFVELIGLVLLASAGTLAAVGSGLASVAGKWFVALLIFANFCVVWGYFTLFEAYWHGQTPGKRVMKLRVMKDSGRQITLFESLARNLLRVVDLLPSFYLVGVVTMLCNRQNQRLGDLVAGTLVVHERLDEPSLLYPRRASALANTQATGPLAQGVGAMFPADAVARLREQDLDIMETFFARMLDLPLETRAAVAREMVAQMCARMGVAVPEGNPERALEGMARQMRSRGGG
ncbi:MAG: RDD family protein [Acidobacteriaceae bacterium]